MTSIPTKPERIVQLTMNEQQATLIWYMLMASRAVVDNARTKEEVEYFTDLAWNDERIQLTDIQPLIDQLEKLGNAAFTEHSYKAEAVTIGFKSFDELMDALEHPSKICESRGQHCRCPGSVCCICGEVKV